MRFRSPNTPVDVMPVYMHEVEYSQLIAIVEAVAPKRCLEWGSGGSTRALLAHCDFIERYVSVEHNAVWHANVANLVRDSRLSLHLIEPDVTALPASAKQREIEAWELRAETDETFFSSYINFPRSLAEPFDFVLVDGRARCFCLREGFALLRSGGVLVLHDAQRDEYRSAIKALGRAVFLTPWHRGQICLVRKP